MNNVERVDSLRQMVQERSILIAKVQEAIENSYQGCPILIKSLYKELCYSRGDFDRKFTRELIEPDRKVS